ncbi:MAG: CHAT domain-containing protein [Bryobacteraceae bacterium]
MAQATALMNKLGDTIAEQIWLGNLGEVHHLRHDYASASSCYRRALELSRRLDTAYFTLMWLNKLTEFALDTGDLDEAASWNRQALETSSRVPSRDSGIWARLWKARLLALRGQVRQAREAYREVLAAASPIEERDVIWHAHAGLATLYGAARQWGEAENEFRQAARLLEERRASLSREEWRLTFQARARHLYEDYVDFLMDRGMHERALEVAEASRARVLTSKLGLVESMRLATARQLREVARQSRAVLLSYWLGPRRSYVWVVEPGGIGWRELPPASQIRPLAEAARTAAEALRDLVMTSEAASRLWDAIVQPVADRLRPPASVIVAPDDALHLVNLETLVAGGDHPHYWIEDVNLCVTPSLALLARAEARRVPLGRSLLLIGDPAVASEQFPRLPAVQQEIAGIARFFPPGSREVVTGQAAHPGAYAGRQPGRFSLIHFAAHAVASSENPLDSAVILASQGENWKLYAREVVKIPLRARLVTLSACRGAGARVYASEGLVGFAWAFLQAGADNVIAGLWDVHDASTAVLMERLYERLARGRSPAVALREAKLSLLRAGTAWSKPYYWAAFQLYTRRQPF